MSIFGTVPKGLTEEEKKTKKLISELMNQYQKKLKDSFCTETLAYSDKELITILQYCINNNVKINTVIPEINDFDEHIDF